jgi:surface protein
MSFMFSHANNLTKFPTAAPNMSKLTGFGMRGMFVCASKFNQPLNHWDVSKVTDMIYAL